MSVAGRHGPRPYLECEIDHTGWDPKAMRSRVLSLPVCASTPPVSADAQYVLELIEAASSRRPHVSLTDFSWVPAVVKFGDLDTTHPVAQEELYRRLSRAVRTVCGPLEEAPGSIAVGMSRYAACIDQAISGAFARINRPEFTDYVASVMHKPDHMGIQLAAR